MERNLRLLAVGFAIRTLGAAMYAPFLALFLYSILGVGYFEIGVIFLGLGAVQLPCSLIGGLWTDRVGRRRLILVSMVTETILTASLGYAFYVRSLGLAIAFAALGGALLAATSASFSAYIADHAVGSERTLGFTWYRIGFNAVYAAGVAIGGLLVAILGFPGVLFLSATFIAVAAIFLIAFLAPSPYDLSLRHGAHPVTNGKTQAAPARGLRESFALLAQDRVALMTATAFALIGLTVSQWNVTYSLFVHNKLGISYALLGVGLAINGLVVVFGQSFTTHRVLGMRHTTIGILGAVFYVAAFLLLGVAALWVLFPVALFFVASVVLTFGENLESIPTSTLPSNLAPPSEVGAYNGAFNMFIGASAIFAAFIGGAVLSAVSNPLAEWVLLCLPAIPGILLLRYASRRISGTADRA